jgi:hypothetical protein
MNLAQYNIAARKQYAAIAAAAAGDLPEQLPAPPPVDWPALCRKMIDDHFDESFPAGHTETIHYGGLRAILTSDDGITLAAEKETPGFMFMDFSCGSVIEFLRSLASAGLSEPRRHDAGIFFQFRRMLGSGDGQGAL